MSFFETYVTQSLNPALFIDLFVRPVASSPPPHYPTTPHAMIHPSATADWEVLEDKYYRKLLLYSEIFPTLDLSHYLIAGAPYSGAIALWKNSEQLFEYRGGSAVKPSIDVYSCAGRLIRRIAYDKGPIRGLGWSEDEKLLVVAEDGMVRCYADLQGEFTQFSLAHVSEVRVICGRWEVGMGRG